MTAATKVASDPDFALVVGAARSGTTLMRLLLDAHPAIGCPGEAGIPGLMGHLERVWSALDMGDPPSGGNGSNASVDDAIGDAALVPMRAYCARENKRIYCDKSLDSVEHLDLVHRIFPKTKSILVFRHVMDTIASGLEASPWGFQAFGYVPYVQSSPDNFVAALANYWLTHVSRALHWRREHEDTCHVVRYEDLVRNPQETIGRVFTFLGVEPDPSVCERALKTGKTPVGPGDYKVAYTTRVHSASVGHGKRVPIGMIPPPMLGALNEHLTRLGYPALDQSWNSEPLEDAAPGRAGEAGARLAEHLAMRTLAPQARESKIASFAIVADDDETLRWVVDPASGAISRGDGDVQRVLVGSAEHLLQMLTAEENPGVLLRTGRVRHITAEDRLSPEELTTSVSTILAALAPLPGADG